MICFVAVSASIANFFDKVVTHLRTGKIFLDDKL